MAIVTHRVDSKTETEITISYSLDLQLSVTEITYSLDNGKSWRTPENYTRGKSGKYTITNLMIFTSYKILTRIKAGANQYFISESLSVATYNLPHCEEFVNFDIGNKIRPKFYNPLKRDFEVLIVLDNNTVLPLNGKFINEDDNGIQEYEYDTYSYKNTFYNSIRNKKSGNYKILVRCSKGDRETGISKTYSVIESECKPDFDSFKYQDIIYSHYTGNNQELIKNKSKFSVYIPTENAMKTKNFATPLKYVVSVEEQSNSTTQTGEDGAMIFDPVETAGTVRIKVTAYDSRELYTTVYQDVKVHDYNPPNVVAELKRKNSYENDTTLSISGTYDTFTVDGVNQNSIVLVECSYRETNGSWELAKSPQNITLSNGNFKCSDVLLDLDNTKAFEVKVTVYDTLDDDGETVTEIVDVGLPTFLISSNKKKAYILGEEVVTVPALENYLSRERSNEQQLIYYTQLVENTDLNKIVETGTYRSIQASHTATMKNAPSGLSGGFTMHVYSWTATSTNTEYRRQELLYAQQTYVRHTVDGGVTWSSWKRVAYVEDMLDKFYPLNSVYCHGTNENPSSRLGGYWWLMDKGFATYTTDGNLEDPLTYFTPATNVTCNSCYVSRHHSTIRIRLELTINVAMTDTGMTLGQLNWDEVGITSLPMGYIGQTSYSDGANGGIVWSLDWNTGTITQTDVFDLATIPTGNKFYFDFTFTVPYERMLDKFCDKFYFMHDVQP